MAVAVQLFRHANCVHWDVDDYGVPLNMQDYEYLGFNRHFSIQWDTKWHKGCHPNNGSETNCTTAYHSFFFVHSFSRKRHLLYFGSVRNLMVCVGGHVLSRSLWCVILIWNAWQCFTTVVCSKFFCFLCLCLIFEEWCPPPPILFDFFVCVFTLASFLIPLFDHAQRDPVLKKNGEVCVFVCACDVVAVHQKICIRMCCSLCTPPHVCVFLCFRVDWLLLHCSVSVLSSSSSFFFCMMCIRLGGLPTLFFCFVLIGLSLHKMLADWHASGDVMRSWLAVYNLSMTSFNFVALCLIDKSAA